MNKEGMTRREFLTAAASTLSIAGFRHAGAEHADTGSSVLQCDLSPQLSFKLVEPSNEAERLFVAEQSYSHDKEIFLGSFEGFLSHPIPEEFIGLIREDKIDGDYPQGTGFSSSYHSYVSLSEAGCTTADFDSKKDTVVGFYTVTLPDNTAQHTDLSLTRYVDPVSRTLVSERHRGFMGDDGKLISAREHQYGRIRSPEEVIAAGKQLSPFFLRWDVNLRDRSVMGVGMIGENSYMKVSVTSMLAFETRFLHLQKPK